MKKDSVSREEVLNIVKNTQGDYASAFAMIRQIPAIPLEKVVYCKDCKYACANQLTAYAGVLLCKYFTDRASGQQICMNVDDYCSYGSHR